MNRPGQSFFLAAGGLFFAGVALVLVGAPLGLRAAVLICALLLTAIGGKQRYEWFR